MKMPKCQELIKEKESSKIPPITAPKSAAIKATVQWKSPDLVDKKGQMIPFVEETTYIRAYSLIHKGNARIVDFQISLKALVKDVKIGGADNKKGYGGFSPRINLPKGLVFSSTNGIVELPQKFAVDAGPWLDFTGNFKGDDTISGVTVLCHESNPGFPTPWILRFKKSMQNAVYPGQTPVTVSKKDPLTLRYQLVTHSGKLKKNVIDRLQRFFNETPAITDATLANDAKIKNVKWVDLFDGKTLNGWVPKGGNAKFEVIDGVIVGTTAPKTPNSFICTEKEYSNFILEFEFMVDEDLNSGVQFRSTYNSLGKERVRGYQVEIDPEQKPYSKKKYAKDMPNFLSDGSIAPDDKTRSWSGAIFDELRRGWLNDLRYNQPARDAFKPDQWNHINVQAIGESIKTWINGTPAADLKDGMTSSGFIALQIHKIKDEKVRLVKWKNIKIKDLSK